MYFNKHWLHNYSKLCTPFWGTPYTLLGAASPDTAERPGSSQILHRITESACPFADGGKSASQKHSDGGDNGASLRLLQLLFVLSKPHLLQAALAGAHVCWLALADLQQGTEEPQT